MSFTELYRVDCQYRGLTYEGSTFKRTRQDAENTADRKRDVDRTKGEYETEYVVAEVKV